MVHNNIFLFRFLSSRRMARHPQVPAPCASSCPLYRLFWSSKSLRVFDIGFIPDFPSFWPSTLNFTISKVRAKLSYRRLPLQRKSYKNRMIVLRNLWIHLNFTNLSVRFDPALLPLR